MTIGEFAEQTRELAKRLSRLAKTHPELTVERNELRNMAFLAPDGSYVGYAEFTSGDCEYFPENA